MFSVRWFTSDAIRAISRMASSVNSSSRPSVATSALYCVSSAFSRLRQDSNEVRSVRLLSSTRIGNRPCSSGIRSEGLETWKAPAAMNRMWSVAPCRSASARWIPRRWAAGPAARPRERRRARAAPLAGHLVQLVEEDDAHVLDAVERVVDHLVHVDELVQLFARQTRRASATRDRATSVFFGSIPAASR